ncbi:lysozyme inhibitor LprI family protein [Enterobacillus tribolii]|uniref:Uncharacterized protein DUF1311 n=1 Tax=Enterobacillus tribolii TaxID=1487935 RepID=A0A370R381_9GAMM|nr:lysozyme inhibitor LprI family protein [Enterobacillus tribolii]MBW7983952.1 DUF1311 domain-containing protein [Enterobacillus tribolii]RDK96890.1 uncharacterized protein DUF1311 [Enterobacillus tribolii]
MKTRLLLLSLIMPIAGMASIYDEAYDRAQDDVCRDILQSGSDSEMHRCMALMKTTSGEALTAVTNTLESQLKKMPAVEGDSVLEAFIADKKAWELYRDKRCKYRVMGTRQGTSLRQAEQNLCIATENYRRIETLKDEPDFP